MERRDFLKCVFATALAPASVVKGLYSPSRPGLVKTEPTQAWYSLYEGDTFILSCFLEDEIQRVFKITDPIFQPPKGEINV